MIRLSGNPITAVDSPSNGHHPLKLRPPIERRWGGELIFKIKLMYLGIKIRDRARIKGIGSSLCSHGALHFLIPSVCEREVCVC